MSIGGGPHGPSPRPSPQRGEGEECCDVFTSPTGRGRIAQAIRVRGYGAGELHGPSPRPSPQRGEGEECGDSFTSPMGRGRIAQAIRVRGYGAGEGHTAPHPGPFPNGERGKKTKRHG